MFPETHTMPTDAISVHVRHGDKVRMRTFNGVHYTQTHHKDTHTTNTPQTHTHTPQTHTPQMHTPQRHIPQRHTPQRHTPQRHTRAHTLQYKEMALHPLSEYMALAREIKAGHPSATTIFLSTEDPDVIEESKKITDFRIVYTDFGRFNRILGGGTFAQQCLKTTFDSLTSFI